MRWKTIGNKKDTISVVVQSSETSVTIKKGGPVFADPTASNPGLSVLSAESLAAASQGFFMGLAHADIAPAALGEAQISLMFEYGRLLVTTRAASTDVWASYAALAIGDVVDLVTTAGVQGFSRRGAGSAGSVFEGYMAKAGTSFASATTQASSLGYSAGNATASMILARMFVRAL